tara:strand:- start:203 stop:1171 length:969 start_codon:yes stop_codon:yes gene_type:complete
MEQRFPFLHSLQDFSLERGKSRSFLIFLMLSFLFWMITKLSNEYTEVITAEVGFDNFPMGVVPISNTSSKIQLTLTESGFQLLYYNFFGTSITLDSRKGIFENGNASIPLQLSIPEIQEQLSGTTEIRTIFPNTVHFNYSQLDNKRLPIALKTSLNIAAGFGIAEPLFFSPDSINVIGALNVLDTLKTVFINTPNKTDIKKSFIDQFNLLNPAPEELEFSESETSLKVVIGRFSEKTIKVPIRLFNVPDSIALKLFPSSINFTFSASLAKIKTITASDFIISCDFRLLKAGDESMKLKLTDAPNQLQNLRWSPKEVEYLIRK